MFASPMGCAGIESGVNIEGGKINAYGGDYTESGGAGIGSESSRGAGAIASLQSIEIRGGTVFEQGGDSAAGIGVGRNSGQTTINNILISDGTVTCNAGRFAAEIGTGEAFSSGLTSIGIISITGGTVTATFSAEGGAAIGTGEAYNSSSNIIGLIQISGGFTTAVGGAQGAGIGAGRGYRAIIPIVCPA